VLAELEAAYDRLHALLGLEPPRQIQVVIYDPALFDRQFAGLFRFSAAGFYSGVIRVRGDTALGAALARVLHHELVHAALDAAMPSTALPGWLNEGLAEWFEARISGKRHLSDREFAALAHFRREGALFSLAQLSAPSFVRFGPDAAGLAYLQSYAMLNYLSRVSGERALRGLVEEMVRTRNLTRAIQRAFRANLAELEAGFQAELG
jgi:transposase